MTYIADASTTSAAEFLRELRGDPNDISGLPQAGGYFLRDGAWFKIKVHHYGVKPERADLDPKELPSGRFQVAA
jgi:hypothetical protein